MLTISEFGVLLHFLVNAVHWMNGPNKEWGMKYSSDAVGIN